MTDEHGTSQLDKSVVAVTVLVDAALLPAVVDFVRRAANHLGLRDKAAEHLDRAVGTVCRNVIDRAFEPDEEGRYDVYVLRRPGQVVIAVEDRGLPFDYVPLQEGSDTALPDMLHRSFADEIRFVNLGRRGNRVELVKHLPHADVREHLSEDGGRDTRRLRTGGAGWRERRRRTLLGHRRGPGGGELRRPAGDLPERARGGGVAWGGQELLGFPVDRAGDGLSGAPGHRP